ncbi:MAG: PAS domain S-box protein [Bacteroidia bacterium]|nr:PAS domain S-box protein [Bacteroidia bacterium]
MEYINPDILVIDDNPDNLAIFRAVVADILPNATVEGVLSGKEGIETARRTRPDVIFLDIVMPEMDGFAVCRALKNEEGLRHIPVVFLTALKTERDLRIAAVEAGAEGFLSKPLDETELLVQIRAMSKIKSLHDMQHQERLLLVDEKERLAELVAIRTRELVSELNDHQETLTRLREANTQLHESRNAALNLLENLQREVEARRLTEANLTMAQRVANVGSWTWYMKTDRLEWSEQMYAIFDIDREKFTGNLEDVLLRAIHPEDAERVRASNRLVTEQQTPTPIEYRIVRPNGSIRTVWAEAGELVLDADGHPFSLSGIVQDITVRKQTEEHLREREERWRTIIKASPDGIVVSSVDGRIEEVSDMAISMFGYSTAEHIVGRHLLEFVDPIHHDRAMKGLERLFHTASTVEEELCVLRRDGTQFFIEIKGEILKDSDGRPARIILIERDITQRKRAEEALRASEALHRGLLLAIPDVVLRFDSEGRVLFASENSPELFGLSAARLTGTVLPEVALPEQQREFWSSALQHVLASRQILETEHEIQHAEGRTCLNVRLIPELDGAASITSVLVLCRDITRQKKIEQDYQVLFHEMLEGFAVHEILCDEDGQPVDYRFIAVNPAFERMTGLRATDILNRTYREILPTERSPWLPVYGKVALTGEAAHFEEWSNSLQKHFEITAFRPAPRQFACIFSDVTEHRKAEAALRESYNMLDKLTAQVPGVVYQYRLYPDGRSAFPFSSPGMYDIYECTPDEVREDATPVFGRLHPDDYDGIVEAIQHSARTLELFQYEFRVILPVQGLRWRMCEAKPERTDDGGTLWYGIISDITERKEAEEKLRASERRFHTFLDSTTDMVYLEDDNGTKLFGNTALLRWLDLTGEEFLGTQRAVPMVEHSGPGNGQRSETCTHADGVTINETPLNDSVFETLTFPVDLGDGHVGRGAYIRDVTERKRANEAVRESEERLRAITESAQDAIVMMDAAARITYWNPAATVIFGYSADEVLGLSPHVFLAPDEYTGTANEAWARFVRTGEGKLIGRTVELQGRRKDGIVISIALSLSAANIRDEWHSVAIIRDITDWKLAELTLRESESRFRTMMEQSPIAYQSLDEEGRFIDVNDELCEFLGYTRAELLGTPFVRVVPLELRDQFSASFARFLTDDSILDEMRLVRKDGEIYDVILQGRVQRTPNGRFLRTHCVLFNITERKQAERALQESETLYRSLFDEHSAIKLLIDPASGAIVDANHAAASFYGWPRDVLKSMNISQINTLPTNQLFREMDKTVQNRQGYYEFLHRCSDGAIRNVEVFAGTVSIKGRAFIHSVIHDVTEKKEAERRIRLLGRSVEQSPVGIMITDPNGSIEYVNPEFTAITGYDQDEVLGHNARLLKSGEHGAEFYSTLWKTILAGGDWSGEFHNRRKTGELYWERAIISPVMSDEDRISHFVAIKQDTTKERQLLADLVIAKEKAEESDRLKSTFLANMSHEVRTPMNTIIGFCELLIDPNLEAEEREQYTAVIRQRSYDLLYIINDILDISLIEAGEMRLVEETAHISAILEDLHLTFRHVHQENPANPVTLAVINQLGALDDAVLIDARRLKQILSNLLSNAFKFTHEGTVTFGCRGIKDERLLFFVEDTGIGIPEHAYQFIFDRFRQVDDSSTRPYGGTGLGLSITRGFVHLMGGEIWVESEPGKGSTFYVSLPLKHAVT